MALAGLPGHWRTVRLRGWPTTRQSTTARAPGSGACLTQGACNIYTTLFPLAPWSDGIVRVHESASPLLALQDHHGVCNFLVLGLKLCSTALGSVLSHVLYTRFGE
jgi:hypothetical protein